MHKTKGIENTMLHQHPNVIISTILKHDKKINTYKFALLRAINDVVLSFLDLHPREQAVAIPLRMLAEYWFAYYYPFCDPQFPIQQGTRFVRNEQLTQDMEFRGLLTSFRELWQTHVGNDPADGFFLIQEFHLARSQTEYPSTLLKSYHQVIKAVVGALDNPIRYAGPAGQQWSVFSKPQPFYTFTDVIAVPGTQPTDMCLTLSGELWEGFQALSLWIEALCIHEWSLYVDKVKQNDNNDIGDQFFPGVRNMKVFLSQGKTYYHHTSVTGECSPGTGHIPVPRNEEIVDH